MIFSATIASYGVALSWSFKQTSTALLGFTALLSNSMC